MRIILQEKNFFILNLLPKEELITSLTAFCKERKIQAGSFTLIGAASSVTLSFYNLKTKKYQDKIFAQNLEITSAIGNIAILNKKPKIHAHGTFSKEDYSVIGGHIQKLVISGAGEIHLTVYSKNIERQFDNETGLFLLHEEN